MLILALLLIYFLLGFISVAYLTLYERHVLAIVQYRQGPSKVGCSGVMQPFSDAFKLLQKEVFTPFYSIQVYYFISPLFMLCAIVSFFSLSPLWSPFWWVPVKLWVLLFGEIPFVVTSLGSGGLSGQFLNVCPELDPLGLSSGTLLGL